MKSLILTFLLLLISFGAQANPRKKVKVHESEALKAMRTFKTIIESDEELYSSLKLAKSVCKEKDVQCVQDITSSPLKAAADRAMTQTQESYPGLFYGIDLLDSPNGSTGHILIGGSTEIDVNGMYQNAAQILTLGPGLYHGWGSVGILACAFNSPTGNSLNFGVRAGIGFFAALESGLYVGLNGVCLNIQVQAGFGVYAGLSLLEVRS